MDQAEFQEKVLVGQERQETKLDIVVSDVAHIKTAGCDEGIRNQGRINALERDMRDVKHPAPKGTVRQRVTFKAGLSGIEASGTVGAIIRIIAVLFLALLLFLKFAETKHAPAALRELMYEPPQMQSPFAMHAPEDRQK